MSDAKLIAPDFLSPSSVSTFNQCPLKFKFSKIDGFQEPGNESTMLGNFVHEVLETLYGMEPSDRTQAMAKSLARTIWTDKWGELVSSIIHNDKDLNRFRWTAWWCIENLWLLEDPVSVELHSVESHVEGEIGGVKIHGYIDRLFADGDTACVTDYKTGKTPRKAYVDQKFFQLIVYTQLLSSVGINASSYDVELLYLKDGVRFKKHVTQEDIDEVIHTLQETRRGIEDRCVSGEFEPRTSMLCNWCGFKNMCPAWAKN